jgi:copper chaperone CopZ
MKDLFILGLSLLIPTLALADEPAKDAPHSVKYRITGLFSPDREADLRQVFTKLPDIKLVEVDFNNAEATLEYTPAKAFPNVKPADLIDRLDNAVKSASHQTFGVKPLSTVPHDKLETIEIRVRGLDCKACSLAAYEAINKLNGVEIATVNFREGRIVARVGPNKVTQAQIVEALKRMGVEVPAQ